MSLFPKVCRLAKVITQFKDFDQTFAALTHPNSAGDAPNEQGFREGLFVQMARHQALQFSGYLLVHANIDRIQEELPTPIPVKLEPLTDVSWLAISAGDQFLRHVNQRIVDALPAQIHPIARAIDPYIAFPDPPYHPSLEVPFAPPDVIAHLIEDIAVEFSKHPALPPLSRVLKTVRPLPPPDVLSQLVGAYSRQVATEVQTPVDIMRLQGRDPKMIPAQAALTRIGTVLYWLSRSLQTIDSILFDAYRMKALPALTRDNIISTKGVERDLLGTIQRLKVQPMSNELFSEPGSVLIVKPDDDEHDSIESGPALIWTTHFNFSTELGSTIVFHLRPLDHWLNPFPGLFANLEE